MKIPLSSGFTVLVKPLPPYYLDFIDAQVPLKEYPKRRLSLVSGDYVDIDYELPESMPSPDDTEDYELYVKYKITQSENSKLEKQRDHMRSDFLLSNCVIIESGPIKVDDNDWVMRLEAAFPDYKVPTHPGKRMLAFLKSNVILLPEEKDVIVKVSCFQEVNLQGIIDALQGFQIAVGRTTTT